MRQLSFDEIPAPARRLLLQGSTGRDHLLSALRHVLGAAAADAKRRAGLLALAQDILLAAWEDAPLDAPMARMLLSSPVPGWTPSASLSTRVADLMKAQSSFWTPPAQGHPWHSAAPSERPSLLEAGMAAEPKNLFWKMAAWDRAWTSGQSALAERALEESSWSRTLEPLRQRYGAQLRLALGDPAGALASLNAGALDPVRDAAWWLRAECLLALGKREEACSCLRAALALSPWRVGQMLRLFDLESGADQALAPLPGPVAILLYSWNKAGELDATLESLAASDLPWQDGGAAVWVLDNGSSDETPNVLERWKQRLGARLTTLRLPVNVGAPAARNWLLSLPELAAYPFLCFLDDDVSLPADWLYRLGFAVQAYPSASVWGCRVVDEGNALVAQSVDLSLLSPEGDQPPLMLPLAHLVQPEFGQYRYLRPCQSVTGCCHLLRREDIDKIGGFDIRFSPSQFDDLERDLRLAFSGGYAAYQGHLCVRHKRLSGGMAERSRADMGNAAANSHKLMSKYAPEALLRLPDMGGALLEADLRAKRTALGMEAG